MRSILIFFITLFFSWNTALAQPELSKIRSLFLTASNNKTSCELFKKECDKLASSLSTTIQGYRACSKMMSAKYFINPLTKLTEFKQGKQQLEHCIQKDPNNIELIYIRYSIQTHVPSFLGYSSDLDQDKQKLKQASTNLTDLELKKNIIAYIAQNLH
jgi:hypothetical protein